MDYRPYMRKNHAPSHSYHDIQCRPCMLRGISCQRLGYLRIVVQVYITLSLEKKVFLEKKQRVFIRARAFPGINTLCRQTSDRLVH